MEWVIEKNVFMAKNNPTSFVLTPTAREIMSRHVNRYGKKKLLCAALYLFDRLDEREQGQLIDKVVADEKQAKNAESQPVPTPQERERARRTVAEGRQADTQARRKEQHKTTRAPRRDA